MSNRMITRVIAGAFAVALGSTMASAAMSEADMMKKQEMTKKELAGGKMKSASALR